MLARPQNSLTRETHESYALEAGGFSAKPAPELEHNYENSFEWRLSVCITANNSRIRENLLNWISKNEGVKPTEAVNWIKQEYSFSYEAAQEEVIALLKSGELALGPERRLSAKTAA